jgi:hypothetical protein
VNTASNNDGSPITCTESPLRFSNSASSPINSRPVPKNAPVAARLPQDLQRRQTGRRGDRIAGQRPHLHEEAVIAA